MSSSLSPEGVGAGSSEGEERNGLSSLGFLKGLTDKKTTRDGQPPKKRGPKPNSKPALTRRQELNRQAQRTHRERKELYIKALEEEVLRLKEVFGNVSVDKDRLAEENRQLKEALVQNGIQVSSPDHLGESVGFSSTASMSGSNAPGSSSAFTPDFTSQTTARSVSSASHPLPMNPQQSINNHQFHDMTQQTSNQSGMDYEQAGIDFVLTYDNSSSKAYLSPPPK
ncbi:Fc.00g069460.m01.CDS01 [Cosmosporella sp. VM-42]